AGRGGGEDAVGRARVEEEDARQLAVEGRVHEPGRAVAVEPDLAVAAAGPLATGRDGHREQGERGDGGPTGHGAPGACAAAAFFSSRQRRTLRTRSRPLNGFVM